MEGRIQSLFAGLSFLALSLLQASAPIPLPVPIPIITHVSVQTNSGESSCTVQIQNTGPGFAYELLVSTNLEDKWSALAGFTNTTVNPNVTFSCNLGAQSSQFFFGLYDLTAARFGTLDYYFSQFTSGTNGDGAAPLASLILSSNTLYGTTSKGGLYGNGTVFSLQDYYILFPAVTYSNFSYFTNLHSFTATGSGTNVDGANPMAALVLAGNVLYGTTSRGGALGNGCIFALNTDGSNFTNLYSFSALNTNTADGILTNDDGAIPEAGLIAVGSTLFGTTSEGGACGSGVVFSFNVTNGVFSNLHSFGALNAGSGSTTNDGANPVAGLVSSGKSLYGTTSSGGTAGNGTVFTILADGSGFTNLYNFTTTNSGAGTNSDGAHSRADLILAGNTLFGTACNGGANGNGTVFALNLMDNSFTNLKSFPAVDLNAKSNQYTNLDGAFPQAGLVLIGSHLCGTASAGGTNGYGTLFGLSTNGSGFTNIWTFSNGYDGANPCARLLSSGLMVWGATSSGGISNGVLFRTVPYAPWQ